MLQFLISYLITSFCTQLHVTLFFYNNVQIKYQKFNEDWLSVVSCVVGVLVGWYLSWVVSCYAIDCSNYLTFTFSGVEISNFEGYEMGLKALKNFNEGTLVLTVPRKLMMTESDARLSELSPFTTIDPLLQNMPNIMLALYLLLEKSKSGRYNTAL